MIWNYANVQKEIIPYPKYGRFDAEPEGMEDEAVESVGPEHERLWENDSDGAEDEAAAEIASDEEPAPFDDMDWIQKKQGRHMLAPRKTSVVAETQHLILIRSLYFRMPRIRHSWSISPACEHTKNVTRTSRVSAPRYRVRLETRCRQQ